MYSGSSGHTNSAAAFAISFKPKKGDEIKMLLRLIAQLQRRSRYPVPSLEGSAVGINSLARENMLTEYVVIPWHI